MWTEPFILLVLASLVDQLYGEYPNRLHPVVWMGACISFGEKIFLGRGQRMEYAGGIAMAALIPLLFWASSFLFISYVANPWAKIILSVFLLKASFALKALIRAAKTIENNLQNESMDLARFELRSLCSRDASKLDREQLVEASASSLAENLSDSVVAPLFYFCIGGVPLALAYRVVNTMDAMIGYKNHFIHLGWAAARLDDVLNWIPARLTALVLLITGLFSGKDARAAVRITWRDHANPESPNGGWPMAMLAGLLGLSFRKPGLYTLGDAHRVSDLSALREARILTQRSGWLFLAYTVLGLGGKAF
ncbi:MAG: cobalamin biosynthesis protein CobD [Oligoflexus sp.]|nr:cobalamin biosynthesis protein CobD [Oligoflexus sp.]